MSVYCDSVVQTQDYQANVQMIQFQTHYLSFGAFEGVGPWPGLTWPTTLLYRRNRNIIITSIFNLRTRTLEQMIDWDYLILPLLVLLEFGASYFNGCKLRLCIYLSAKVVIEILIRPICYFVLELLCCICNFLIKQISCLLPVWEVWLKQVLVYSTLF